MQNPNRTNLWKRKRSSKIHDKIWLQVPRGNHFRIPHKFSPSKNPTAGRYVSRSKLDTYSHYKEEIGHRPEERDHNTQSYVDSHTSSAADYGEVEIQRVYKQGEETRHEKYLIPFGDKFASRI